MKLLAKNALTFCASDKINEVAVKNYYDQIRYIGDLMEDAIRLKAVMELNPTVASVQIMFWDDVERLEGPNESYK